MAFLLKFCFSITVAIMACISNEVEAQLRPYGDYELLVLRRPWQDPSLSAPESRLQMDEEPIIAHNISDRVPSEYSKRKVEDNTQPKRSFWEWLKPLKVKMIPIIVGSPFYLNHTRTSRSMTPYYKQFVVTDV